MKYTRTAALSYGVNSMVQATSYPELMGLNFDVLKLRPGETHTLTYQREKLVVLLEGRVSYTWHGQQQSVERASCFHDLPHPLHLDCNSDVTIANEGSDDCELIIVSTENEKSFLTKLYRPEDLSSVGIVGETELDGKTKRIKRVFFDRSVCPQTNIFCGELVNFPGCWACFPPHLHVEPEIYFYRFLPEGGYGFSEHGDEVFKVRHNELVGLPGGLTHSQVTAPGYAGFIFWAQKLQDNGKDIEYHLHKDHAWVEEPEAKFFPER